MNFLDIIENVSVQVYVKCKDDSQDKFRSCLKKMGWVWHDLYDHEERTSRFGEYAIRKYILDDTVTMLRRKGKHQQELKEAILHIQNETASQLEKIYKPEAHEKMIPRICSTDEPDHTMEQLQEPDKNDTQRLVKEIVLYLATKAKK